MPIAAEIIAFVRHQMVDMLDGLSIEQINRVPDGFRNNLIWNLAHVVVVQEGYLYQKAGQTLDLDPALIAAYGNGTVPDDRVDADGIERIKALALATGNRLAPDLEQGVLDAFEPFTVTPRKIAIDTATDGINFLMFHEGLHLAAMGAIKRLVNIV